MELRKQVNTWYKISSKALYLEGNLKFQQLHICDYAINFMHKTKIFVMFLIIASPENEQERLREKNEAVDIIFLVKYFV